MAFWLVLVQVEADRVAIGADFQDEASCRRSAEQNLEPGEGKEASSRAHRWALKICTGVTRQDYLSKTVDYGYQSDSEGY